MDLGISQTNAGRARKLLAEKFFPKDATSPKFLEAVSEVVERFHTMGSWVGSKSTFTLEIPDSGIIFLPHFLDSIISARVDKSPAITHGPRYEFMYDGPGELDPTTNSSGDVIDKGLSPIEAVFPEIPCKVRVTATTPDIGKVVRILGTDDSGDRIVTDGVPGEELVLVDGIVTSDNLFASIQGIQKDLTVAQVSLACLQGPNLTQLGVLESYMELPVFRSYSVLGQGCDNVIAYCKRRALPIISEEDYILPGNISALKLGLYARNYEEKNDRKRAREFWTDAIDILNNEATEYRGGVHESMEVAPWGMGISKVRNMT